MRVGRLESLKVIRFTTETRRTRSYTEEKGVEQGAEGKESGAGRASPRNCPRVAGAGVRLCLSGREASASSRQANESSKCQTHLSCEPVSANAAFPFLSVLDVVAFVKTSKPVGWKRTLPVRRGTGGRLRQLREDSYVARPVQRQTLCPPPPAPRPSLRETPCPPCLRGEFFFTKTWQDKCPEPDRHWPYLNAARENKRAGGPGMAA